MNYLKIIIIINESERPKLNDEKDLRTLPTYLSTKSHKESKLIYVDSYFDKETCTGVSVRCVKV